MKSVSVLPAFVSQDADLKAKDSALSNDAVNDSEGFSSLVDKHLNEGADSQSAKDNPSQQQSEAAKADKEIAANGKKHQDTSSQRQESDSQTPVNAQDKSTDKTIEKQANKADTEEQLTNNENEALAESEQFISLLYNSDQTLNDSKQQGRQHSKTSDVGNTNTSANTQNMPVSDAENISEDEASKRGQESTKVLDNAQRGIEQPAEHKLKAFSNDELLKHAQLKGHNALSAELSGQALKDYQAALQSKQAGVSSDSITSEQLLKSQLAEKDLNNKVSDIAASVSKASNGLFKEKQDPGLYQLPVEPIVKGEIKATADTAAALKAAQVTSELKPIAEKATLTVETKADSDAKLAAELTSIAKGANIAAEQLNAKAEKGEGKVEFSSSLANNGQSTKANHEKVVAERSSANVAVNENTSKEQPVKQPAITSAPAQAIQHSQNPQKEQLGTNDQQAFDEAVDEYAYTDSNLLAQTKSKLQPEQNGIKTVDSFNLRSAAEIHSQALQANQLKQSNDAYAEHQAAEVLNHNVATDVAQIQKNNVQLQQETISIFRKDFTEAVKDKVMVSINQKLQQFDITLDPPEFGNMQVRVNLQGEQAAVNFVVQNQQAKDALEQNMHKLKDMLAEQGVDVGGANVEQQSQQQGSEEEAGRGAKGELSLAKQNTDEHTVEHVLSAQLFDSSATGVDYYA